LRCWKIVVFSLGAHWARLMSDQDFDIVHRVARSLGFRAEDS
jgi:hypothetical protein